MSLSDKTNTEIMEIVTPIMDNLMDASTHIDHELHTRDFTDRLKKIVSKDGFATMCQNYQAEKGFFAEREMVGIFRRSNEVAVVYRQYFTKQEGEFVAEVLIKEVEGQYLVDHALVW